MRIFKVIVTEKGAAARVRGECCGAGELEAWRALRAEAGRGRWWVREVEGEGGTGSSAPRI